jgi:hypothetical protein
MPLTPTAQILISILMPLWLLTLLGFIALYQAFAMRITCLQGCVSRWLWKWPSYQRTMVAMYLFGYSSVATTLVSYMVCTEAKDKLVIFEYPAVSCDDSSYRTGNAFVRRHA